VANTKGAPNGCDFDSYGNLYICDFAHQGILIKKYDENQLSEYIKEYEGRYLKGPNSIIFDSNGTLYFTDSGPIGETSIQRPQGSVFCIVSGGDELLQPIALECLAHPSGLALSPMGNILYVAETMKNRILRFVQKPLGVWHYTVFHQFSGGFGPTALACHPNTGELFVANFDFEGMIYICIKYFKNIQKMGRLVFCYQMDN
jgi:sugar lactone lactonase YvrE